MAALTKMAIVKAFEELARVKNVDRITVKEKIKSLGVQVHMVTGDNEKTARYIGKLAHVDHVVAEVLPEDKADVVNRLQKEGKTVMMVGDGINDAPALVQADAFTTNPFCTS